MIHPLEELLHIVCQLSLMCKPLFQVPLKHIADACNKVQVSMPCRKHQFRGSTASCQLEVLVSIGQGIGLSIASNKKITAREILKDRCCICFWDIGHTVYSS